MQVIGLTGGIAMGKSNAARVFARARIPVFDADATVHRLQARGGAAVAPIGQAFPGVVRAGEVDRAELRRRALADPASLRILEAILHPLVRRAMHGFLASHRRRGARLVVLDIPLLFETGRPPQVDRVAVVTAPAQLQRQRLQRRARMADTMTDAQVSAVLARQLDDRERRRRADVLIRTGLSRRHTQRQILFLIASSR